MQYTSYRLTSSAKQVYTNAMSINLEKAIAILFSQLQSLGDDVDLSRYIITTPTNAARTSFYPLGILPKVNSTNTALLDSKILRVEFDIIIYDLFKNTQVSVDKWHEAIQQAYKLIYERTDLNSDLKPTSSLPYSVSTNRLIFPVIYTRQLASGDLLS